MSDKLITDKELEQWKTMCEDAHMTGFQGLDLIMERMDAFPRLIAEVERLRGEIDRLDMAYWHMTLLYHNVKDELYGRGD